MNKRILYSRPDGGVSIIHPTPKALAELNLKNEDELIDHLLAHNVPPVATNIQVIDIAEIPLDRTFRDAWETGTSVPIKLNMEKAKIIHIEKIRKIRDSELEKLDKEELLARRGVHPQEKTEQDIWNEKQILQDIPNNLLAASGEITLATTQEILKKVWPAELPELA